MPDAITAVNSRLTARRERSSTHPASTNYETESIRALFFIADYTGRGAGLVFKTAGYFPALARVVKVPSQMVKTGLRDGTQYEFMPLEGTPNISTNNE